MSAVLDAIAGGRGLAVYGLKLALPGLDYQVARTPYTSVSGGHFYDRAISLGSANRRVSDIDGSIGGVQVVVRVADHDRTIQRIYSGIRADEVRGSAAFIYLMTPTVVYSSEPRFVGVLTKVSFPEPFVAELTLRSADDQLLRLSGRSIDRVTWPNALAESFNSCEPILYGLHDASYVQTGPGLVPTLYVDTTIFQYLVCRGKAKSVIRAYVNGVQADVGLYSVVYVTKGGRIYTCINFVNDQGTAVITCDAEGYETVGDGSGTLITNPATQWAHRMTNFVFGDYKTGAWFGTNALVDAPALAAAEAYLTAKGARGSDHDDEKRSGKDITAVYCVSFGMRSFWTPAGTIATDYEKVGRLPYTGTRWIWYQNETAPFTLNQDDYRVTRAVVSRQARSASQGSYLSTLTVVDAAIVSDIQETLDLERSESR